MATNRHATQALVEVVLGLSNIPDEFQGPPDKHIHVQAVLEGLSKRRLHVQVGEIPNLGAVLRFMNDLEDASG